MQVKFKQLSFLKEDILPKYATDKSAGMDLHAAIADNIILKRGAIEIIPCGFAMALPDGYEAQIRPRSGLAAKHGVTVLNSPGTIDADYRGEVKVILINHGNADFTIEPFFRIAQMVIAEYQQVTIDIVQDLAETSRSDKGFGSTGL